MHGFCPRTAALLLTINAHSFSALASGSGKNSPSYFSRFAAAARGATIGGRGNFVRRLTSSLRQASRFKAPLLPAATSQRRSPLLPLGQKAGRGFIKCNVVAWFLLAAGRPFVSTGAIACFSSNFRRWPGCASTIRAFRGGEVLNCTSEIRSPRTPIAKFHSESKISRVFDSTEWDGSSSFCRLCQFSAMYLDRGSHVNHSACSFSFDKSCKFSG